MCVYFYFYQFSNKFLKKCRRHIFWEREWTLLHCCSLHVFCKNLGSACTRHRIFTENLWICIWIRMGNFMSTASLIITFSTFRSSVFTNGRILSLTCYCAKCGSAFYYVCFTCFFIKMKKNMSLCFLFAN